MKTGRGGITLPKVAVLGSVSEHGTSELHDCEICIEAGEETD